MSGDVLLIEQSHWTMAEKFVEGVFDKLLNKQIIAIAGESGSGKSCLSYCIAKTLKDKGFYSKIISLDNYYLVPAGIRDNFRKENGLNSIGFTEIDWKTLDKNIFDFKNNMESSLPIVELLCDLETRQIIDFSKVDILIIEGLYSLKVENTDYKIYLESDWANILSAQALRNKETINDFRLDILKQESEYVQLLKPLAEYVFNFYNNCETLNEEII